MGRNLNVLWAALLFLALGGCDLLGGGGGGGSNRDYAQDMRDFVQGLSAWAKAQDAGFVVIPQNGQELLTDDLESTGPVSADYVAAIDGQGREDLNYGYEADDQATPAADREYMIGFLDVAEANGVQVLVTDYVSTQTKVDDSYIKNDGKGYTGFAAADRELGTVPAYPETPHNESGSRMVDTLADAQNFLYVLNPAGFPSLTAYQDDLDGDSNGDEYDLLIVDLFHDFGGDQTALSGSDVADLKIKPGTGTRLVIAYMSIGEAEDYRYYWQTGWKPGSPGFIGPENPHWPGNYKVRYWDPEWQAIIFGNSGSYLQKILDSGFDGVYLDIIDAFEYWENN